MPAVDPIDAPEFAGLIAALAPFEPRPQLAIGTSGGADSLALCLLAARWARRRGGRVQGLIVNHRLRRGSGAEARKVSAWLGDRGIAARVLTWREDVDGRNLQARAREARLGLLTAWCRDHGVLHLLLAHHLDDQAETVLLRLGRGSGVEGLAAIAPLAERDGVRLLRPLLSVPKARLRATLVAAAQEWIEDPSNADDSFARVRMRAQIPALTMEGVSPARLARTARHLARARVAIEETEADLLARVCRLHPAGFVWLDCARYAGAPDEIALRALARLLTCLGGAEYGPRFERLQRLHVALKKGLGGASTLHGCRIIPAGECVLVCREPAAAHMMLVLPEAGTARWDGRFDVGLSAPVQSRDLVVARLGVSGRRALRGRRPGWQPSLPHPVCASLPALWQRGRLLAVPHLDVVMRRTRVSTSFQAKFRPSQPLLPWLFAVV